MLRRSDLLARKIDMERLKSMTKKGGAPAAAPAPAAKVRFLLLCYFVNVICFRCLCIKVDLIIAIDHCGIVCA